MNLEREVIVDLLPAYFSGEASAATRALVEDFFKENPDFEKSARSAGGALETLRVSSPRLDPEKEKLALERARMAIETRSSLLWVASIFTLMLVFFRVRDHKIVWVMWEGSSFRGIIFAATAVFLWLMYFHARRHKEPVPQRVRFLWIAVFYSLLPFLFSIKAHKIVWLFGSDPEVAFIMGAIAILQWGLYFYHTWKAKRTGL